jgi:hypothetical protein
VNLNGNRANEVAAIHAEPLVDAALALNHPGGDAVQLFDLLSGVNAGEEVKELEYGFMNARKGIRRRG